MLGEIFNFVYDLGGLILVLTGALVWGSIFLRSKAPMDASNRINRIRIIWFAISAPHRFAHCRGFTWLQGDERDNLKDTDWTRGE